MEKREQERKGVTSFVLDCLHCAYLREHIFIGILGL